MPKKTHHLSELDQEIIGIQRSTKTFFSFAAPLHNAFRMRFRWYYNWHRKSVASSIHTILLLFYIVSGVLFTSSMLHSTPESAYAADIIWDGGGTTLTCGVGNENNWSCAENWSTDTVPTGADNVILDNSSAKDAIIDAGFGGNIQSLSILSGYSGTVSLFRSITLMGGFTLADGTFTANDQTVSITMGGLTISGGVFNASSNTIGVQGELSITGGTFNHNNGTISLETEAWDTRNVSANDVVFHNLIFQATGSGSMTPTNVIQNSFTVANDLTFVTPSDALDMGIIGNGSPTITVSNNVTFTPTPGSPGLFTLGSTIAANNLSLNVGGNFVMESISSTVYANINLVDNTLTSEIVGSTVFHGNLSCTTNGKSIKFQDGGTQTINGTLTLTGSLDNPIVLRSTAALDLEWQINPQGSRDVSYVDVKSSNNINTTAITASNSINSGGNTNWIFSASIPTVTTSAPTSITATTANFNGTITATGGENATTRGFEYRIGAGAPVTVSESGSFSTGAFSLSANSLTGNTSNYQVRAFAINSTGTGYGDWISFVTPPTTPPAVTAELTGSPLAENGGTATVTARLEFASTQDVTVNLVFSGTATNVNDYTRSSTSITISAGATTGTVTLTGVDDSLDENDETIVVDIDSTVNGTESGTQQVTAAITDDDTPPTVTLSRSSATLAENGGDATITAHLSVLSAKTITINLAYSGTATNVSDYTRTSDSIIINPGNSDGTITLTGVDDVLDEDDETILVDIDSITNGTENGTQQQTVAITDDDAAPTISFTATTSSGSESTTPATVTVALSAVSGKTVTVNYATADGTAAAASDYTAAAGTLTFNPGDMTKTIEVVIINDSNDESNETWTATLSNPANASLGTPAIYTYTINDNDDPPPVAPTTSTATAQNIAATSTTLHGSIDTIGSPTPTLRGFEYRKVGQNIVTVISESGSFSTGAFSLSTTNLDPGEAYEFRSFAQNTTGTGYGLWDIFSTPATNPTVTTADPLNITASSITLNGSITMTGGATVTTRGFQYHKIGQNSAEITESGSFSMGSFTLSLANLEPNTTYQYRSLSTNTAGTGYGNWITLTTLASSPSIITGGATDILSATVMLHASISTTGGSTVTERGFEYRQIERNSTTISEKGEYGVASFSLSINQLSPFTTYQARGFAINSIGVAYGDWVTFSTPAVAPTVRTTSSSNATTTTIVAAGSITVTGGLACFERGFEYRRHGEDAVSTFETGAFTAGSFMLTIGSLAENTDYEIRAYATNAQGTGRGEWIVARTLEPLPIIPAVEAPHNQYTEPTLTEANPTPAPIENSTFKETVTIVARSLDTALQTISNSVYEIFAAVDIPKEAVPVTVSTMAAGGAATSVGVAALSNLATFYSFPEFLHSIWYSLLVFSGLVKTRKGAKGKVVEMGTNVAIPHVKINVYRLDETTWKPSKLVAITYTDANGQYSLIVEPGWYKVETRKVGYDQVIEEIAHHPSNMIHVHTYGESLINKTIAVTVNEQALKRASRAIYAFNILERITVLASFVMLTLGTIVSVDKVIHNFGGSDFFSITIYTMLWVYYIRKLVKRSPWGTVLDAHNNEKIALAIVRILDPAGRRLIKTAVTNESGRFAAIVEKGQYKVIAAKPGYNLEQPLTISTKEDAKTLNFRIKMNRL